MVVRFSAFFRLKNVHYPAHGAIAPCNLLPFAIVKLHTAHFLYTILYYAGICYVCHLLLFGH